MIRRSPLSRCSLFFPARSLYTQTTDIAKMVSKEWREMEPSDRAVWEEKSREDKERYEAEKARFKIQRPSRQGGKRILKGM